ncbi:MAG: hypothetical protein GXY64_08630 [Bacteroidales bacterium]|nr:hypothetical protein [Bacteroidales bacterium]
MKKVLYKSLNKMFGMLITLLGFSAPITLASCYGPMPEEYVTADELTDSVQANEKDSLAVSSDSVFQMTSHDPSARR